ncbi:MAG: methyltransferase, TIGR04325 family [Gemmatimonadaceae bacterium]|nr:methyltransferase, TIGR04325 family [Gemmatimonadaceae bacterium]
MRRPFVRWLRALREWRAGRAFFSQAEGPRFFGCFPTRQAALSAIRPPKAVGYDYPQVTELNFVRMCEVAPWDAPVIEALRQRLSTHRSILDLGGHLGTKFRAFRTALPDIDARRWTVWELPSMVVAGTKRAQEERLAALVFTSDLSTVSEDHDLVLASGLLQYLEGRLADVLRGLSALPRTLIINKLAVTDGNPYFMLENLGYSAVPYHVRRERDELDALGALGFRVVERWVIPELSHEVPFRPERGASASIGLVLERT